MKKIFLLLFCILSQVDVLGQSFGLKSNLLYDGVGPNLGVEVVLSQRLTLDLNANYNPFSVSETKKWKHLLIQPELRYWLCQPFSGHFIGVHLIEGEYNIGGINVADLKTRRIQGNVWGGGVSYGHHWILSPRWGVEASVGLGVARFHYDKYICAHCGYKTGTYNKTYLGPTKVSVSLVYLLK